MTTPSCSKFRSVEEAWFDKAKKGKLLASWQNRFFSLDMGTKILSYYPDAEKTSLKGHFITYSYYFDILNFISSF